MFIFRVEHKREHCASDPQFKIGGSSSTGHGPFRTCINFEYSQAKPNFGLYGNPPTISMMVHERCAVTAEQWDCWITPDNYCADDLCDGYCTCPYSRKLKLGSEWHIVCYWVEDNAEGIDWRIDAEQIVFNPAFAINLGTVAESEIFEITEVSA